MKNITDSKYAYAFYVACLSVAILMLIKMGYVSYKHSIYKEEFIAKCSLYNGYVTKERGARFPNMICIKSSAVIHPNFDLPTDDIVDKTPDDIKSK